MQDKYTEHEIFEKADFTQDLLPKGEYENCHFNQCNFANQDLSSYEFTDCVFNSCNLSLAKLEETTFRSITFKDCKMLGLRFDTCNQFGLSFSFEDCQLNHSSFYKTNIKKTCIRNCDLQGIDFVETILTSAVFDNCNLAQAVFDNTVLEKSDIRSSFNYSINPELNKIKKAKFSLQGITGLLEKYDIVIE